MLKVLGGFGLLTGASYPFRSLRVFINKPSLWGYVTIPILVNFVVGFAVYGGLLFFNWEGIANLTLSLTNWLDKLIANLPTWLSFLDYLILGVSFLLRFLLVVLLLLFTEFLLLQFGVLLGASWYVNYLINWRSYAQVSYIHKK